MPKIVREDIDNLNAVLTVTIEKTDYEPHFTAQLKKHRAKANFKGFRKGKTPLSFVKKMYGLQILGEVINDILQEQVAEAMSDKEVKFLGQPIPPEDYPQTDLSVKELEDYEFKFEIGKAPVFEVMGVGENDVHEQYKIEIPKEDVNKDFEAALKRHGERSLIETDIQEDDLVKLEVKELEGDSIKEGGRESDFGILVNKVDNPELKEALLSKKKDDTVRFNIFEVESHDSNDYAMKYFLKMTEEEIEAGVAVGPMFEGTITEVSRVELAEVNQEFFDKQFGEGLITSEEEAREKIKEGIGEYFASQTEAVLFRNLQDRLIEDHKEAIPLPDAFLKRWLISSSEANTAEMVEKDYDGFADNLRWSLIKGQLAERFEVTVTEEDIKNSIRKQVAQYMGGYGDMGGFMDQMIERTMQDKKAVENAAQQVLDDKLFDKIKETVTIQENTVTIEEFGKIVDELKTKNAPAVEEEEE